MMLKSLEMQGFKSFPDKTKLEFGTGITAVVGPNGSGKSNISDAVRWALGEQSTKSLRGARMEDVIFSGAKTRRAQGFAEVTLTLDNSDRSLNIDSDEVSVSRRYYRSGESDYMLNKKTVRLKDVHEVFMGTGLGRDGYSIISQGKIADLISVKSDDRREIFEEAAGISKFRYRRNDAQKRLAQAQDNLIRLRDILAELESRVEPLRIQSEKAQKYVVLANEKKELEIGIWLNDLDKTKERLKQQETKIAIAENQHEKIESELTYIESDIEETIAKTQEQSARADELRRQSSAFEEEKVRKESEITVFNNTIEHNKETIDRISKELGQTVEVSGRIEEQISEREKSIEVSNGLIDEKSIELARLSEDASKIQDEHKALISLREEQSLKLSDLQAQLSEGKISLSTAENAIKDIHAREGNIEESLLEKRRQIEEIAGRISEMEDAIKENSNHIEESVNSLRGYEYKLKLKKDKAEKSKETIDRIELELHKAVQRRTMLEDMEKNLEGYYGSVKAVIRESKRGNLKGICGPTSKLMDVPENLSVSIETALGAAMQNIVTENEENAKSAIRYLKTNKLGRATFLPLTSVKGRTINESDLSAQQGFVGIASDLIGFDEKYRNIFESLLGRTVIAESLNDAVNIAKSYGYRFRIVSLDGQLINAGGSMTGGSQAKSAGILSRANEIKELSGECARIDVQLKDIKEKYKQAKQEESLANASWEGAQAELSQLNELKIRLEGELKVLLSQEESAKKSLRELEEEKEDSTRKIEDLNETVNKNLSLIESLAKDIEAVEAVISENERAVDEASGRLTEIDKSSSELDLEILAARKDVQAHREALEALLRRHESHTNRFSEYELEIKGYETKNIEIITKIEKLELEIETLRTQSEESKIKIEDVLQIRAELEKKSSGLRQLERHKSSEREKVSGELARLEERKAALIREYDEIISKLYDEYELTKREAQQIAIEIVDPAKSNRRLNEIKSQIRGLGSVNVSAIEEYKEVYERYIFLRDQIEDAEKSKLELLKIIEELTRKMNEQFQTQFEKINKGFGEIFIELFGGGSAELLFEDPSDALESAIIIKVQPPGKKVQNIDLFSGGEKALSAIALLFAILKVTPSPFCIFDEVEAALDDVNVDKYAQYIRKMTANTQFILITHRRGSMEEADVLYGVTMQEEGVSKLLEMRTSELAKDMGLAQ